jgi:hypothetical protein
MIFLERSPSLMIFLERSPSTVQHFVESATGLRVAGPSRVRLKGGLAESVAETTLRFLVQAENITFGHAPSAGDGTLREIRLIFSLFGGKIE